jgi:hypothetical protein
MKSCVLLMLGVLLPFSGVGLFAQDVESGHRPEPPQAGIHWAKGQAPTGQAGSSPNLLYHGGPIMGDVMVTPIFWGPSWGNGKWVDDKMTGLATFYTGINLSTYADTVGEYTASVVTSGTSLTSNIASHLTVTDLSPAKGGQSTLQILAEVCKVIANPVANGYYPVYTDTPRHNAGFCAWHSAGTCNGTPVQFAFFFNLDGDPGCDPQDTSRKHSQGLAALANVSGHELSEARNDPRLNAWYDSAGSENADKCAWTFGTPLLTFSDGSQWKIQGNWSNSAYNTGRGYPNSNGQKGCIDGGNYK